ncbi:MAG TPA: hypothetical protein VGM94_01170 [Galbitalea sp.]|jgi:hypothetical protein
MSPKTKTKRRSIQVVSDLEITPRDFVMARLAAARASAQAAIDAIDECIAIFVNPDDDKAGKERAELVDAALESVGAASRALESAESTFDQADMKECEPWEDDDDENGDDDEEEEDSYGEQ